MGCGGGWVGWDGIGGRRRCFFRYAKRRLSSSAVLLGRCRSGVGLFTVSVRRAPCKLGNTFCASVLVYISYDFHSVSLIDIETLFLSFHTFPFFSGFCHSAKSSKFSNRTTGLFHIHYLITSNWKSGLCSCKAKLFRHVQFPDKKHSFLKVL